MRAVSDRFMRAMAENSTMLVKASIIFSDGTKKELSGEDFFSLSVETASSSSGSFDVGAAVIGKLACALNNHDDRFSEFDFQGAVIRPYIGKSFGSETDWLPLGVFNCDQPDSYAGQIQLTALDNLSLMESKADLSQIGWPCTLQQLVDAACAKCGLVNDTSEIPNGKYAIGSIPDVGDASWLDVVAYAAQLACCFVVATDQGHVALKWYDTHSFEAEDGLDGGEFDASSPYSTGDKADGGDFTDYSNGAKADGGDFAAMKSRAMISMFSQLTVFTDDVVVTGVSVTAQNEVVFEDGKEQNGEDGESALYGSEGYVLDLGDNPLVLFGEAANVASMVGKRVVGMRFRPFSADAKCDPSVEVGDAAYVFDRKGNRYETYLTSLKLTVNGSESMACEAKSAGRNAAEKASAVTEAIRRARNDVNREKSARELAVDDFKRTVAESSGLFTTKQVLADGSTVTFLHDKSDLGSSRVVWKMTAEAVSVSTDGGKTYATGIKADGTAILDRIYAIGIDADHITSGTILSKDGKHYFDLDTGRANFWLDSSSKLGETTIEELANTSIKSVEREYTSLYRGSNPSYPGNKWTSDMPAWRSDQDIWCRDKIEYQDGRVEIKNLTRLTSGKIAYVDTQYSVGDDSGPGQSWGASAPILKRGEYLWARTRLIYEDDRTVYSEPEILFFINQMTEKIYASVQDCEVEYGVSSSEDVEPSTWLPYQPGWVLGQAVWSRTRITSVEGDVTYTAPVVLFSRFSGGVKFFSEQYYLSTSDKGQEGGTWSKTQQPWVNGRFYWTRTRLEWADGSVTYSEPVLAVALTSANQSVDDLDGSLTAMNVFNRLTDNGKKQGIFTDDKGFYFNASYIKSGEIDASKIRVKNIMSIGDKDTSLRLSGDKVTFYENATPVMGISHANSSMKTFCLSADSGVLYSNKVSATKKKEVSFPMNESYEKLFYKTASGKYGIRIGFSLLWRRGGYEYKAYKADIVESTYTDIPVDGVFDYRSPYGEFYIGVKPGSGGTAQLVIGPGSGNPVGGDIQAVYLFYSVGSPSADISTPGDPVLTAENLTSVLKDHYPSYCLSLPYQFNNQFVNIRFYFIGGILAKLDVISPNAETFDSLVHFYEM